MHLVIHWSHRPIMFQNYLTTVGEQMLNKKGFSWLVAVKEIINVSIVHAGYMHRFIENVYSFSFILVYTTYRMSTLIYLWKSKIIKIVYVSRATMYLLKGPWNYPGKTIFNYSNGMMWNNALYSLFLLHLMQLCSYLFGFSIEFFFMSMKFVLLGMRKKFQTYFFLFNAKFFLTCFLTCECNSFWA